MCATRSAFVAGLLLALVVFGMGCSQNSEPRRYPVSGKVFYQGKPAHYAKVSFVPADHSEDLTPAGALVDADGEFHLLTNKRFDGAEAGQYLVSISWKIPGNPRSSDDPEYGPELLPKRFQDPKTSGLSVTVEAAENEVPVFDLNP